MDKSLSVYFSSLKNMKEDRQEMEILTTWQKDSSHDMPYDEYITVFKKHSEFDANSAKSKEVVGRVENEDQDEDAGKNILTPLERAIFLAVLDELQDVILIFTTASNEPIRESWKLPDQFRSPSERFLDADKSDLYESSAITDSQKLIKDTLFFYNVIRTLTYEIEGEGTFDSLRSALEKIFWLQAKENDVFFTNLSNEQQMAMLQVKINEEKEEGSKLLEDLDAGIYKLKWFLEDLIEQNRAEFNYLDSWENVRFYLNGVTLNNEEKVFTDIIENATTEMEREMEAHKQIENYIEESREDYLQDIEYWIKKYDEDLEQIEADILKLNMKYEALMNEKAQLSDLYDRHRFEMQQYLDYKEEQRRARNLAILQMQAATKIQRWWRRILMKRKKKKKGKGKGKDGKKKKK